MVIREGRVGEEQNEPTNIETIKTVINPNIHAPIVEEKKEVVNVSDSSRVEHNKTIQKPLVESEHPQRIYETKKTILRSWQIIWFLLSVIEVFLIFRIIFKAIGANPLTVFVSLIYAISDILISPFVNVLGSTFLSQDSEIEWSVIIAALVYALVAFGLSTVLKIARPISPEETEQVV